MATEIAEATVTCNWAPYQVEGKLADGRCFYFKARSTRILLGVGSTPAEAVAASCGFDWVYAGDAGNPAGECWIGSPDAPRIPFEGGILVRRDAPEDEPDPSGWADRLPERVLQDYLKWMVAEALEDYP